MKKILLVEDDSHLQLLIAEEFRDEGYEVTTASDGREALSLLFESGLAAPDLIIMDIRMPRMDGLDALGHILKSRLDIPVVIHSAYMSYRDNAVARTADAYIVKSHDFTRLKQAVGELINRNASKNRAAGKDRPHRAALL